MHRRKPSARPPHTHEPQTPHLVPYTPHPTPLHCTTLHPTTLHQNTPHTWRAPPGKDSTGVWPLSGGAEAGRAAPVLGVLIFDFDF